VRWGQLQQAFWLLERGASPNVADPRGWTAMHQAASRGNLRLMKALLEAGGNRRKMNKIGQTPLDIARSLKRSPVVALLG